MMLKPCLGFSSLAQRYLLLRTSRMFSSEIKTRIINEKSDVGFTTQSREDFERAFPRLAAKQKHHLKMLKDHHLPVHRGGGPLDDRINQIFYAICFAALFYSFYQYYVLIKTN